MRSTALAVPLVTMGSGATLFAGIAFAATLSGTDHRDRVRGTAGGRDDDTLRGGGGNDRIFSNQGQDEVFGDDGDDDLWSLSRYDVTGSPDTAGDTLHGGAGNDVFHVRDGEQDLVDCGDGTDTVLADAADIVDTSCEKVIRKAPRSRDDLGENNTQSPREDRREH